MAGKRAAVLRYWMMLIDHSTLNRAFYRLTQDEFDWEPHPGAWGVRRREAVVPRTRAATPVASGSATKTGEPSFHPGR